MDVLLPVVAKHQPERAQGVFRLQSFPGTFTDPLQYIIPLGYLVSIWQKLQHNSYPADVKPLPGKSGEGFFDATEDAKWGNWSVTSVNVDIVSRPEGDDMVYGENPLIQVGRGAFFTSTGAHWGQEWSPIAPLRTTAVQEVFVGLNVPPPGNGLVPPQVSNPGFREGFFGETRGINATNFRPVQSEPTFIVGVSTLGYEVQKPKPTNFITGGVETTAFNFFPLVNFNFNRNTFDAPSPRANGFWWKLKPGVVADITIYGTLIEPGVEAGPTESGTVKFNPMKGELIT